MDFITFTGAILCGGKPELKPEFCRQAQENGMGAVYHYFLQGNLPDPLNIMGAFPEFFPEDFRSRISGNGASSLLWRKIFLTQHEYENRENAAWKMHKTNTYSLFWFKRNIIQAYERIFMLKRQNQQNSLLKITVSEFNRMGINVIRHTLKRDRKINQRNRQINQAANGLFEFR